MVAHVAREFLQFLTDRLAAEFELLCNFQGTKAAYGRTQASAVPNLAVSSAALLQLPFLATQTDVPGQRAEIKCRSPLPRSYHASREGCRQWARKSSDQELTSARHAPRFCSPVTWSPDQYH